MRLNYLLPNWPHFLRRGNGIANQTIIFIIAYSFKNADWIKQKRGGPAAYSNISWPGGGGFFEIIYGPPIIHTVTSAAKLSKRDYLFPKVRAFCAVTILGI